MKFHLHSDGVTDGSIRDGTFRQLGGLDGDETGTGHVATVDLSFRMTTNGVIVSALVNDEPLSVTSAGLFNC